MPSGRNALVFIRSVDFPDRTRALTERRVLGVEYSDEEKSAPKLKIVFDNKDGELWAEKALARGSVLEVAFGYEGLRSRPLRCVVRKLTGPLREVTVEAHGVSVMMDTAQRRRVFRGMTRSDVVRAIAREHGFADETIDVEDTSDVFPTISQAGLTDAAFLARLARREGKQFAVDEYGIHWRERDLGQPPVVMLTYGGPGSDFLSDPTLELDNAARSGRVKAVSRDPVNKKTTEVVADNKADAGRRGLGPITEVVDPESRETTFRIGGIAIPPALALAADRIVQGVDTVRTVLPGFDSSRGSTAARISQDVVTTSPVTKEGATAAMAKGRYREETRTAVKMSIEVNGDPRLMSKRVIAIRGLPAGLSGQYWIASCTHSVKGGDYVTTAELRSDGRDAPPSACDTGAARADVEAAMQALVQACRAAGASTSVAESALAAYRRQGSSADAVVRDAAISLSGPNQAAAVRAAAMRVLGVAGTTGPCDPDKSEAVITKSPPVAFKLVEVVDPETRRTSFQVRFQ